MVKKRIALVLPVCIPTILGCSGTGERIRSKSAGVRTDVFEELREKTPIPEAMPISASFLH